MTFRRFTGATILGATLLTVLPGMVLADQGRFCDDGPQAHSSHRQSHAGRPLQHLMAKLELDASQQQQVEAILEKNRDNFRQQRRSLRDIQQRMHQAISDEDYDSRQIESLADEKAKLAAQMAVQRSQVMRDIYLQLTPEQQATFRSMQQRGRYSEDRES